VQADGPSITTQSNQDLLAEIFGSSASSTPAVSATTPAPSSQRSTVDDILGLFGSSSTPISSAPVRAPAPVTASAIPTPLPQSQLPPSQAPASAPTRLPGYAAYDQNGLTITLTPQTSTARPGVVMIMARFQVTGESPATSINFQAAVPKVNFHFVKGSFIP